MSDEHVVAESDNPKIPLIVAATAACVVIIIAIVVGVDQLFRFTVQDEVQAQILSPVNTKLRQLRADEQKKLNSFQWVNQAEGVVRIPKDLAVKLVIQDWEKRPIGMTPMETAPAPAPAEGQPAPEKK